MALSAVLKSLRVPSGEYDIVYAGNANSPRARIARSLFEQIKRALKPGGTSFGHPFCLQPALSTSYRRMATEVRTKDERPLTVC